MNYGKLYLVATPIGNLEDITFRAVKTLKEVDIIAAEDTRQTLKLLNHFQISKPLISYHRHNEEVRSEVLINKLLEGMNIAIVTDAGTPGISDPGEVLVKEAIKNKIQVCSIPGPCALINALVVSGLDTKEFSFYGFLPINKKLRRKKFEDIKSDGKTSIIYEAPHRLISSLKEIEKELGSRQIVVAKELTKIHEKYYRGTVSDVLNEIEQPKGEYIIIIKGEKIDSGNELNSLSLEEHYNYYKIQGLTKKEIVKRIARDRNVNKNEIYQYFL